MNQPANLSGRTGWVRRVQWLGFAVVSLVILIALAPQFFYHWDEVQLRLGIDSFDLRVHHPHPPGYFSFILLARLAQFVLPDSIEPGRFVSSLAASLVLGLTILLLPMFLSVKEKLVWTFFVFVLFFTLPVIFFYSLANLTYTAEAFFWILILVWIRKHPVGWELLGLFVLIGFASGVRQNILIWSILVVVIESFRVPGWLSRKKALPVVLALAIGILTWAVPVLTQAGGIASYIQISKNHSLFNVWNTSVFKTGLGPILKQRLPEMLEICGRGLGILSLVFLAVFILSFKFRDRLKQFDLFLIGGLISFFFYLLVTSGTEGYLVTAISALLIYSVVCLATISQTWPGRFRVFLPLLILAGHLTYCYFLPKFTSLGYYRQYQSHDLFLRRVVYAVRSNFPPRTTILICSGEYWYFGFRHVMYYLPEYTTIQLTPDIRFSITSKEKPYLTARQHRVFTTGPEQLDFNRLNQELNFDILQTIVYMIPWDLDRYVDPRALPDMVQIPVGVSTYIYALPVKPGQPVIIGEKN